MSREITVDLFHLDDLSAILGAYLDELKEKKRQIVQNTAEAIRDKAQENFDSAVYEQEKDVHVTVEEDGDAARVVARGESVPWIEFGAGQFYNGGAGAVGSYPHPWAESMGMSAIGTYGQGKGARDTWVYLDGDGEKRFTHGTPIAAPMYNAAEYGREVITDVARWTLSD